MALNSLQCISILLDLLCCCCSIGFLSAESSSMLCYGLQIFNVLKRVKSFRESKNSLDNSQVDDGALGRAYHALRSHAAMLHAQRRRCSASASPAAAAAGMKATAATSNATPASAQLAHRSPLPRHQLSTQANPGRRRQLAMGGLGR